MKRSTKRRLSTAVGCVLGVVTCTGPLAGQLTNEWQHKRGLCGCTRCRQENPLDVVLLARYMAAAVRDQEDPR